MALILLNRNYRLLFSATAISNLGDGVSALALPWLATTITRDPTLVALVAAAGRLPWLLFSIPAGVVTDRANRQSLLVRSDITRLFLTFGIIALILTAPSLPIADGKLTMFYIGMLSFLAFLLGTAEVLRDNTAQTILPSVVDKKDLERANGQLWSVEQIMGSFIGPPLAGFLIAMALPIPFAFDAVTFAVATGAVWMMTMEQRARPELPDRFYVQMKEGMVWIWKHQLLFQLAVVLGLLNMLYLMAVTVLVLFGQEVLGLSAVQYGILLTAGAAGGVFGGLMGPSLIRMVGVNRALKLALFLFPIPMLMIYLTADCSIVAIALFVNMFAAVIWNLVTVSFRQRIIPDKLLGRVNSIYRFFGWGMMPIGALLGGMIVSWYEPEVGREAALRIPYLIASSGAAVLFVFGVFRFTIPEQP